MGSNNSMNSMGSDSIDYLPCAAKASGHPRLLQLGLRETGEDLGHPSNFQPRQEVAAPGPSASVIRAGYPLAGVLHDSPASRAFTALITARSAGLDRGMDILKAQFKRALPVRQRQPKSIAQPLVVEHGIVGPGRGGRVLRGGNGLDGGTCAPGLGGLPGQYPARKVIPTGAATSSTSPTTTRTNWPWGCCIG
jgi:hypothetical protein